MIEQREIDEAKDILKEFKDLPNSKEHLNSEDLARKSPQVLRYFAREALAAAEDHTARLFHLTGILLGTYGILSLPCEPFV